MYLYSPSYSIWHSGIIDQITAIRAYAIRFSWWFSFNSYIFNMSDFQSNEKVSLFIHFVLFKQVTFLIAYINWIFKKIRCDYQYEKNISLKADWKTFLLGITRNIHINKVYCWINHKKKPHIPLIWLQISFFQSPIFVWISMQFWNRLMFPIWDTHTYKKKTSQKANIYINVKKIEINPFSQNHLF